MQNKTKYYLKKVNIKSDFVVKKMTQQMKDFGKKGNAVSMLKSLVQQVKEERDKQA